MTTRETEKKCYLFAQNFSNVAVKLNFSHTEYQVLLGDKDGQLKRYETMILVKNI